ncbi:MAG: extracellular solute-binding protein [Ilumatobacter sp.]|uniref:extracellular solute-binding protein n=1 Tax=Ilumatobacter sp. TaxID=1967498 RepID=UPI0026145349|nr:extracellular solute-binding protein [Ilumatobacter sp.]MDJ0767475.1 extracellular solute-binding protein [Ilumatobacter sp.]
MHRRINTSLASLLAGGLLVAACGSDGDAVTIYSGRTENLIEPILEDFTESTGIEVSVRYGQSADLALLIEEEAAAGQSGADVFLSQSPGAIGVLDGAGRLAELPAELLELVPENVRDGDGRWIGFSGRQRVLVYNTDLVDESELPSSVFDLTGPEWAGRVGVAPPNGSFQDFVTSMRATEGEEATREWLEGLSANGAVSYPNNNSIVAAVGRGEVDAGLVNHYYNFRFLDEDPSHPGQNHIFPPDDPGGVLIVTAAGILEGTDQPDDAAALIEFLLGTAGQQYFAEETFEYPLADGEQPAGDVPAVEFGDAGAIDYESLGGGLDATRELIIDAGLEG